MDNSLELSLMDSEERELVDFIDREIRQNGEVCAKEDILWVLDTMDDFLEEVGLLREDPETGEVEYLEGDVDETEQLNYVLSIAKSEKRAITGVQIQLIQDAELQFGIQKGYYEEE